MLGENTHFKIKVINLIAIVAVIYIYNLNLSLWETTETLKFQETRADMAEKQLTELESSLDNLVKQYGDKSAAQEISASVPQSKWKDGVYQGEGAGFAGNILVEVTIENGVIANIEVLDYGNDDEAYVNMAVGVIDAMLETQSSEVDAVSGATFSSNGIKAAVTAALQEAEGE